MVKLSDDDLAAKIARLEVELGKLKRLRRARAAAKASARVRNANERDNRIRLKYAAEGAAYGLVRALAAEFHITPRQIQRIVHAKSRPPTPAPTPDQISTPDRPADSTSSTANAFAKDNVVKKRRSTRLTKQSASKQPAQQVEFGFPKRKKPMPDEHGANLQGDSSSHQE